jgi:hypothetical protein
LDKREVYIGDILQCEVETGIYLGEIINCKSTYVEIKILNCILYPTQIFTTPKHRMIKNDIFQYRLYRKQLRKVQKTINLPLKENTIVKIKYNFIYYNEQKQIINYDVSLLQSINLRISIEQKKKTIAERYELENINMNLEILEEQKKCIKMIPILESIVNKWDIIKLEGCD